MKTALVFALLAAASSLAVAAPAGGGATKRPSLALADATPLTFAGRGFKRAERVRVTAVVGGRTLLRRVAATQTGTFTARFEVSVAVDPCSTHLAASAVGSAGSRAAYKLPQRECPPPAPPEG